jgi:hypothetical protein
MKNLFSLYIRKKMKDAGIVADYQNSLLSCKCTHCGYVWFPQFKTGGKFHGNFWKCTKGCNKK